MIKIGSNKFQLCTRLVGQVVLLCFSGILIYRIFTPLGVQLDNNYFVMIPIAGVGLFANFLTFIQNHFVPIGVIIDPSSKTMRLRFSIIKEKPIYLNDMISYSTTVVVTSSDKYEGLLIHLVNGKKILLSDFNLKDYKPIQTFLEDFQIKNNGKENFSVFSYYFQYLR